MRAIGIALGILSVCRATADSQAYSPKTGVGMAFIIASPAGQLAGFLNLFVPLNLGSHFRLEPQIGWHTASFDAVASDPSSPVNSLSGSSRVLLLGVGLTYWPRARPTRVIIILPKNAGRPDARTSCSVSGATRFRPTTRRTGTHR